MNLRNLSKTLGLDESDVLDLVDLFLNTCESDIAKVADGIKRDDHQAVADAAHSIKGASGNMRFQTIYTFAKDIEDNARAQDLKNAADQLAGIRKELEQIAAEMKTYRK